MKNAILARVIAQCEKSGITFKSGKYFSKDTEIRYPNNYIKKIFNRDSALSAYTPTIKDFDEIKGQIKTYSEELSPYWPELEIVREAKTLGPIIEDSNAPFTLDTKQLIILNILLYHPNEEVMFITTGIGGSGKSTYLNIVKQLFDSDYASIPLSELTGFMVAEAVKSRLICSDELGKGDLDTKILKTLISKQPLDVNPKYGIPFKAKCQSSLFYCCNKAPRIDVTDTGILRRIIFYERNTKILNPDRTLNSKTYTRDELLWFARRALDFEKVYDHWRDYFILETHKYLMKDNSVYINIEYDNYLDYKFNCNQMGLKAYSEPNWQEIRDLFQYWIQEDQNLSITSEDWIDYD